MELPKGPNGIEEAALSGLTALLYVAFTRFILGSEAESRRRFAGLAMGLDGSNKGLLP